MLHFDRGYLREIDDLIAAADAAEFDLPGADDLRVTDEDGLSSTRQETIVIETLTTAVQGDTETAVQTPDGLSRGVWITVYLARAQNVAGVFLGGSADGIGAEIRG